MLKIGDKVYKVDGAFGDIDVITLKNDFEVGLAEKFWGSLYFDDMKEAEQASREASMGYGSYLNEVWS